MTTVATTISLPPDTIDDLIYHSRTGDLPSLTTLITDLSKTHGVTPATILTSAIDIDADGLGSGSSLLHYPSANGNVEVVLYLLSLLGGPAADGAGAGAAADKSLLNHQNVSGNTALHWAGMNGRLAVVKALVGAGADPSVVNAAGRDAVVESEWSSREGAAECADWMLGECGGLETGVGGGGGSGGGSVEEGNEGGQDQMNGDHGEVNGGSQGGEVGGSSSHA